MQFRKNAGIVQPLSSLFLQLIFPISLPNHWALAVVDTKKQTVEYLDPAQDGTGGYMYSDAGVPETVLTDLVRSRN